MRAVGLVCGLMRLKFVYLSERKGVCGANALNFVILRVKNVLNSDILAFSKALNAKSVVNSVCGVAWQNVVNSATHNTANSAWQVLVGEAGKAKMEQYLGGGLLSLVAGTFWQAFGLNLKDFFVHSRAKLNAYFVV